jgi:hypothetical protein
MKTKNIIFSLALVSLVTTESLFAGNFEEVWTRTYNSLNTDGSYAKYTMDTFTALSVDTSGNIYVGGYTPGLLYGSLTGTTDAIVAKYDSSGNALWTKKIGTAGGATYGEALATDAAGNVYFSYTNRTDMSSLKSYTASGTERWSVDYSDSTNLTNINTRSIKVDTNGAVYMSGSIKANTSVTSTRYGSVVGYADAYIAQYSAEDGETGSWSSQYGTTDNDSNCSIALDSSNNVYAVATHGTTAQDISLSKYDESGNKEWSKTLDSGASEYSKSIMTDSAGNVYVVGNTKGALDGINAGKNDIFLAKYDSSGEQQWVKQFGTDQEDSSAAIVVDALGNIYLAGTTYNSTDKKNNILLLGYDAEGDLIRSDIFATTKANETVNSMVLGSDGYLYLAGMVTGKATDGTVYGEGDAFITKYAVPEPTTFGLLSLGLLGLLRRKNRRFNA